MKTPFTEQVGIEVPLICGAMYPCSNPELVAAASEAGALIVSPLDYAVPAIRDALAKYPHIRHVLPALGYGAEQLEALRESIAAAPVDAIVSGTPIDLAALIDVPQPIVRARYEYEDTEGEPSLASILDATVERLGLGAS